MKLLKHWISSYSNILLLVIPLLTILVLRVLGFDGLYGQDGYEYFKYTEAIKDYALGGDHPGKFYWPVFYPLIGGFLGFIFNNTILGLQILSSISLSVSCIYSLKAIKLLYPKQQFASIYILIFGLFCPYLFKIGLVVMSDATSMMFVVLCLYYFLKSYKEQTSLVFVFFFATCAVMTRYAALVIVFPLISYGLYLVLKRKAISQFLVAILISSIAILPFVLLQWDALFKAGSNYFLNSWSVTNFFKSSYTTIDGLQSYFLPNILYTLYVFLHPGFIFIGIFLCFFTIKKYKSFNHFSWKITELCILLYLIFMAGIPFQNPRILGLVFPFVLILLYHSYEELLKVKWLKTYYIPFIISAILFQLFLFNRTFSSIYKRNTLENEIVNLVKPYQGQKLYSFDVDIALKGRGLNFEYKNMFFEIYNDFKEADLVLFNPNKFSKQWNDKNPMLNWEYLKDNYRMKSIEDGPDGWKLYKIQNKK
ncbi:glycosyltransferase family 39 protein [Winogradskyella sp.]|uniref:ArnT family glycosyltransferase n=1 Tax=Winogradskyella sp. TaxID=1883156 RepID=UPI0025CDCDAB|nr:glycosyltransferase family 39 protein [Winogradskyella sp.]